MNKDVPAVDRMMKLEPITGTTATGFGIAKLFSLPMISSVASAAVVLMMTLPKKRTHHQTH